MCIFFHFVKKYIYLNKKSVYIFPSYFFLHGTFYEEIYLLKNFRLAKKQSNSLSFVLKIRVKMRIVLWNCMKTKYAQKCLKKVYGFTWQITYKYSTHMYICTSTGDLHNICMSDFRTFIQSSILIVIILCVFFLYGRQWLVDIYT